MMSLQPFWDIRHKWSDLLYRSVEEHSSELSWFPSFEVRTRTRWALTPPSLVSLCPPSVLCWAAQAPAPAPGSVPRQQQEVGVRSAPPPCLLSSHRLSASSPACVPEGAPGWPGSASLSWPWAEARPLCRGQLVEPPAWPGGEEGGDRGGAVVTGEGTTGTHWAGEARSKQTASGGPAPPGDWGYNQDKSLIVCNWQLCILPLF